MQLLPLEPDAPQGCVALLPWAYAHALVPRLARGRRIES